MCASLASIFLATTFAVNTMPETAHDDRRLCDCVIVELCKCGNAELMQSGGCYDKRGTSVPIPLCLIPLFHNSIIPQSRGGMVLQPAWPCLAFVDAEFFSRWRAEVACDVRFWHRRFRGACRASTAVPVLAGLEHGARHLSRPRRAEPADRLLGREHSACDTDTLGKRDCQ